MRINAIDHLDIGTEVWIAKYEWSYDRNKVTGHVPLTKCEIIVDHGVKKMKKSGKSRKTFHPQWGMMMFTDEESATKFYRDRVEKHNEHLLGNALQALHCIDSNSKRDAIIPTATSDLAKNLSIQIEDYFSKIEDD